MFFILLFHEIPRLWELLAHSSASQGSQSVKQKAILY